MSNFQVSHTHVVKPIPRGVLIGAAVLIALTIALAGTARLMGLTSRADLGVAAVETRALRFADQADGSIAVSDPASGRVVAVVAPGSNGFLRGALRGLARERKRRGIDSGPPFELIRWADGRLGLIDPATSRTIDLAAFGATNAGAFAGLLTAGREGSR